MASFGLGFCDHDLGQPSEHLPVMREHDPASCVFLRSEAALFGRTAYEDVFENRRTGFGSTASFHPGFHGGVFQPPRKPSPQRC